LGGWGQQNNGGWGQQAPNPNTGGGWGQQAPNTGGWGQQPANTGGWGQPQVPANTGGWGQQPQVPGNTGGWGQPQVPANTGGWGQPQVPANTGGWGQPQVPGNTGGWGQQPQVPGNTGGNMIPGGQNILGFVTPNATWGNQLEGNKWVQFQQQNNNFSITNAEDFDVVKFLEQQITLIEPSPEKAKLEELRKKGQKFLDERFPPNNNSLCGEWGNCSEWKDIKWAKIS